MARRSDPEPTFEQLMEQRGVTPLEGDASGASSSADARSRSGAPAPTSTGPAPKRLREERDTARSERDALRRQRDGLEEEREALREERDAARRQAEQARQRAAEAEERAAELEQRLEQATAKRDAYDQERRTLNRRLTALQQQAVDRPEPLDVPALLADRGLADDELADALLALLAARPDPLLEALQGPGGGALADLLDQRLVLSCGQAPCRPRDEATANLEVAPARCEICGGSDAGAAFHRFARACDEAGLDRVVVLGGSPNYRRVLRRLADADDRELRLELVDGRDNRPKRKVKSTARTADLVVVWCSTIIDHATTDAYEAAGARTLRVPHRGIATMLGYVADALG